MRNTIRTAEQSLSFSALPKEKSLDIGMANNKREFKGIPAISVFQKQVCVRLQRKELDHRVVSTKHRHVKRRILTALIEVVDCVGALRKGLSRQLYVICADGRKDWGFFIGHTTSSARRLFWPWTTGHDRTFQRTSATISEKALSFEGVSSERLPTISSTISLRRAMVALESLPSTIASRIFWKDEESTRSLLPFLSAPK